MTGPEAARAAPGRVRRRLVVSLLLFATAVLLAELLLRSRVLQPERLAGWRSSALGVSRDELNELGYRGAAISYVDDDTVIVLLGGSNLEATACAFEQIPERVLERQLRALGRKVRVFSIGSAGYGQDQQLLALREYLAAHRADLVLLWFQIGNDLFDNLFPTHANGWPKPTFWLEDGRLAGPSWAMGENVVPRRGLLDLWRLGELPDFDREWERRLPPAYQPLAVCASMPGSVRHDWQARWDDDTRSMRVENLATEKSHFAPQLVPPSPRMLHARELTRALLGALRDAAAAQHGRFVIFEEHEDLPIPPEDRWPHDVQVLNGNGYRTSFWQPHAHAAAVRAGFEHFDMKLTDPDPWVSPHDHHLNARALEQVLHDLAVRLAPSLPQARIAPSTDARERK